MLRTCGFALLILTVLGPATIQAGVVKIGMDYPRTGPYAILGLDQYRAAEMAIAEINAGGGVLGDNIEIVWRDTRSRTDLTARNVTELIDHEGVKMVLGGSANPAALAAGQVCQARGVPFFGTLTYCTTTGGEGHRHTFRECHNAWMGARAIADYLKTNLAGKKYFYITADHGWGHTTEASMRKFTETEDKSNHQGILIPFPDATDQDIKKVISLARSIAPDILVLVLFGNDMTSALRQATARGLKQNMQIVVPNLTLGLAEVGGPQVMAGVIGAVPWCWQVPYRYNYPRGQEFVTSFAARYDRYPSTSGASAYTIIHEWKAAVDRAGSHEAAAVIAALEGHEYQLLKDPQVWRDFDHQSVQTVYAVRCKPEAEVRQDMYGLDYFEIVGSISGDEAVRTREEWNAVRRAAGKPAHLEALPGE